MGGIRVVDIVVGYETSVQPTSVTPSVDADVVTKGYADDTYTPYASVGANVADINALKAVAAADRYDEQLRFVNGLDLFYQFDADSTATPDDDLVVQPTVGTGRWLKIESGAGGSAGASNIESALQKLGNEKYGIFSEDLDNAIHESGVRTPVQKLFVQRLMKNYAASDASIEMWHNPTVPWAADPALDSTTGWTVTGAGATLTATNTVGEFQLGTHGLKFDKNGTGTAAGIRYDLGAQTFSAYQNYRVWFKVNMPSVTDLVSIKLRLYADTTSNFSTYTFLLANGQYNGSAITTGWNTFLQDVSASGTSGGTGWLYTQLLRYAEVEVVTGSAGQTYTGVILDSFGFSYGRPEELGVIGDKFTLYNNSTHDGITIDNANTRYDGPLTLVASVANSYVGTVGASRSAIERSKVLIQDGLMAMERTGLSGTIVNAQAIRLQTKLRESLAGSYQAAVDMVTPQVYKVTSVGGGSITVEDPADTTANLVSGNTVHVFRPLYSQGKLKFTYRGDLSVTSSSHSSGSTTINGTPPAGSAIGDYAVKKHLSTAKISVVGLTDDESFSTLSVDASPNGIQLLDTAYPYPFPANVLAHYPLGAFAGSQNKFGASADLTLVGTLNSGAPFKRGKTGTTGWSASNFYRIPNGSNAEFDNQSKLFVSAWLWPTDNTAEHHVAGRPNASINAGWQAGYRNYGPNIYMLVGTTVVTSSNVLTLNAWNHCVWQYESAVSNGVELYINSVLVGTGTATVTSSGGVSFTLGHNEASGGSSMVAADVSADVLIGTGVKLTQAQINSLYNRGASVELGTGPQIRYLHTANGQSGQKVSFEGEIVTTTSAITPAFYNVAVIKSS